MNKKLKLLPLEKGTRCFLMTLINAVTMVLTAIGIYFASFFPIGNATFGEKEAQMNQDREVLLRISQDSKLGHIYENGNYFSINDSYVYYLNMLLKYNYETSEYDMEKDLELYKEKQEEFKNVKDITVTTTVITDDFIGEFFTIFAVDKKTKEGQPIVDYLGKTPKDYFYYEILDIDGVGKEFFKETTGEMPYLKDDVRKALYQYNCLRMVNNDYYKIDSAFFNYFVKIFDKSGTFLLSYGDYKETLDRHDAIFLEIQNYQTVGMIVSFLVGFTATLVIFPLFNKYKRNPAEIILKRAYLREDNEGNAYYSTSSFVIRTIYSLIKYFFAFFLMAVIINLDIAFASLLYIGSFPISLFTITVITLLINAVSFSCSFIRTDRKNLENLLSRTRVFSVEKDYTSASE